MEKKKMRVALYMRVATADQDKPALGKSMGIVMQEFCLNQYCQEHGLTVSSSYIDDGFKGVTDKRESYRKLMEDAEHGKIDLVLTTSTDRLARDPALKLETLDRLKKCGCRVVATRDGYDSQQEPDMFDLWRFLAKQHKT